MGSRTRNSTGTERPRARNGDLQGQASPERAAAIAARLAEQWPDAVVELDHENAYHLLVATILAAQSTDKTINTVTPALFARYPDANALARADQAELEPMIYSTGFYRMKAKHLIGMAQRIAENHGGEVPDTMAGLVDLPGVARKTANVVLGSALGKNEGVVVDTHVTRLAARLGLSPHTDPLKIEQDLMHLVPRDQWSIFAHRLIWHGRRVCHAKKPDCEHCTLAPLCPSAGLAAAPAVGAKPAAGARRAAWTPGHRGSASNASGEAGGARGKVTSSKAGSVRGKVASGEASNAPGEAGRARGKAATGKAANAGAQTRGVAGKVGGAKPKPGKPARPARERRA